MNDQEPDASENEELQKVLDLLEQAREPVSDDPEAWTPPEVISLALMYAYGVDALPQAEQLGTSNMTYLCNDILFNRDMLQDWIDAFSEDALEALIESEIPDLPLPSESDSRLHDYYLENRDVRDFIENEYAQFREEINPPRSNSWWWLDAELYGKQIH